jgi:DNA uptake protein ComE-like DNA-binding protein
MKAFIRGLGLGALIGIVIAPAEGRETRRRLKMRGKEWQERVRHNASKATTGLRRMSYGSKPESSQPKSQRHFTPIRGPLSLLNYGSREELMAVKGIGEVLADRIIKNRPYGNEQAVLENKDLPPSILELVKANRSARKAG